MASKGDLSRGDRVTVRGRQGTVGRIGGEGTNDQAGVEYPDGSLEWVPYSEITKMSLLMDSSALCPYCDRRTDVKMSVLGDHRIPGGVCDGSGRHVARLDSTGRAVLAMARDITGREIHVGDVVIDRGTAHEEEFIVKEVESDYCRLSNGARVWSKDLRIK